MIPFLHINWSQVAAETLMPGLERQYLHSPRCTVARFVLKQGTFVPEHRHPNEQIAFVASGALRFRLAGEERIVRSGEFLVIPENLPHSAEALEDTVDFDVFTPPRTDWNQGQDSYLRK